MINISQSSIKFKLTELHIFSLFLFAYSLLATIFSGDWNILYLLLFSWIFSYIIFLLLQKLSGKNKQYLNTFISTTIFFLVFHYTNSFIGLIPYSIGLLTIQIYKHFGYFKGTSALNPAMIGLIFAELTVFLLITFLNFHPLSLPFTSWWGAEFGGYTSLILILGWLIYGTGKWHKQWIMITFLSIFLFDTLLQFNPQYSWQFLLSSTVYFFASIMLIEPKTSPALKKQQIVYGAIAAIIYFLLRYLEVNYFELIALASANLYNFASRQIQINKLPLK